MVKLLNEGKEILVEYIAYAHIMIESKASGILFMERKISVRDISSVDAKLARWLCENHHIVVLHPGFKTKDMVKSGGFRKIQSKTARQMMTWSHFCFRQHLLHKSREYPWCKVVPSALRNTPVKLADVVE